MQFRTQAFPWCPQDASNLDVGSGTLHPFRVKLQKQANWYWGVRFWTATINVTDVTAVARTITVVDMALKADGITAAHERELVCGFVPDTLPVLAGLYLEGSGTVPGHDISTNFQINLFSPVGDNGIAVPAEDMTPWDTAAAFFSGGLYYPLFVLRMNVTGEDVEPSDLETFNDSFNGPTPSVFTFDGHTVPTYAVSLGAITSVEFAPQAWWPYAPESNSNLPIYRTDTGRRIRTNTVSD